MIPKWSQSINLVNLMWLPGGHQVVPNRVRIEEGECARIARPFLLLVKESLGKLEFFMFMQFCFIFKSSVWVRALYYGDGDDDDDDSDDDDDDDQYNRIHRHSEALCQVAHSFAFLFLLDWS